MTWRPTCTVSELASVATTAPFGMRSSWSSERSAATSEATTRAGTVSPPRNSTVISSIASTTCAAVIILPSVEMSTPEPVSLNRTWPEAVTSRPLARITPTEGLTLRNSGTRSCAATGMGAHVAARAGRISHTSARTTPSIRVRGGVILADGK